MADPLRKFATRIPDRRTSHALLAFLDRFVPAATEQTSGTLDIGGITSTQAEIDRAAKPSARVVATTATVLALTVTQHAERVVLVNTNSTVANTITLPASSGSGARFTLINNIAQTQGTVVVTAAGTVDVFKGVAYMVNATVTNNAQAFFTSATSKKVTLNLTTTGGATGGDTITALDSTAGVWVVEVRSATNGTTATPFAA